MKYKILREQNENNMEDVISKIIKFNNYFSNLSEEQKKEFLNNPKVETPGGVSMYEKALEFLNGYKDAANTDAGKASLNSNDQKATNAFREFQNNLVTVFPSVYNSDFQPVVIEIINSGDTPEEVESETPTAGKDASIEEIEPVSVPDGGVDAAPSQETAGNEVSSEAEKTTQATGSEAELAADERLKNVFKKYMGGEYDSASSLDKGKNEVLKSALKQFYDNNGKRFDINNPDDVKKFQPIINKAYASSDYKNAATLGRNVQGSSTTPTTSDQTPKYQVPTPIKFGKDTLPSYVDMGGGKYRPATQEDVNNPKTQLYIRNPKKGRGEYNKPEYVQVRREGKDFRPQSGMSGAAGSASNFAGDVGTSIKNFFSGGKKEDEKNSQESQTTNRPSVRQQQSPTADRPPARIQSR